MKSMIKGIAARVLYMTGLASSSVKWRGAGKALILSYHHVIPREKIDESSVMPGMYLSSEAFEEEMEWLRDTFTPVSLGEIIEKISSGATWERPVCSVTFDDGWRDVYEYAFPILKEKGVPATVFLVGGLDRPDTVNCFDSCFELILRLDDLQVEISGVEEVDAIIRDYGITDRREKARLAINKLRSLPYDAFVVACRNLTRYLEFHCDETPLRDKYRMLSVDDMQRMGGHGIDFGYHSRNHYILTQLPDSMLGDELTIPTEEYRSAGIDLMPVFCYPDGKYNEKVVTALKKQGYRGAVTLQKGYNSRATDLFTLKRVNVHEGNAGTLPLFISSIGILNR